MKVDIFRSDLIYKKIITAPSKKRADIFRHELMQPFKGKWDCYNVPMKASSPGGYDVIMACSMLGYLVPPDLDQTYCAEIELLSTDTLWQACQDSLENSIECFTTAGIELPVKNYLFTLLLGNPENPYMKMSNGYSGDGGIPGYIFGSLIPNAYTMRRMPVAIAHECNHNIRFQFEKWSNDITLADMMISEGLAENFATFLYGEEMAGPWVTKTDLDTLNSYIKPLIKEGLDATGMDGITPYLYGDEMAKMQNYFPVGLPYCAGYACGYHAVQYYLRKTGKSIVEATLTPAKDILGEIEDFWGM